MSRLDDSKAKCATGVFLLTMSYFVVEIILNYTLYKQLASHSNLFTIEVLEIWGQIITGMGAALICTRLYFISSGAYQGYSNIMTPFKIFRRFCLVTIPLSFLVQHAIISYVVDRGSDENKNNAILITAAKSVLVPHYDYSLASYDTFSIKLNIFEKVVYPLRSRAGNTSEAYVEALDYFGDLGSACSQHSEEVLGIKKGMDKALFGFGALMRPSVIDEKQYKALVKDFYRCLYEDKAYSEKHRASTVKPMELRSQYASYSNRSKAYWKELNVAMKKADVPQIRRLRRDWDAAVSERMGFKSTLNPSLSWEAFARHPDVKRYYLKMAGEGAVYPYGDDWDNFVIEAVTNALPEKALPGYKNSDGTVNPEDPNNKSKLSSGEEAYKSIVMPIVGLGMSAFFLIFNLFTAISSGVRDFTSKEVGRVCMAIMVVWAVLWPSISLRSDFAERDYLDGSGIVVKMIYYHERSLAWLYSKTLD